MPGAKAALKVPATGPAPLFGKTLGDSTDGKSLNHLMGNHSGKVHQDGSATAGYSHKILDIFSL